MEAGGAFVEEAVEKLKANPSLRAAAVMVGRCGDPDIDGRRWTLVVTDGNHHTTIDALVTDSERVKLGDYPDDGEVETAVERRIDNEFPFGERIAGARGTDCLTLYE